MPRANATVYQVPGGDEATRRLGIAMVYFARLAAHDPEFVLWARSIVRDIPSKAHHMIARRILEWVRANVRYIFDPLGLEWQQDPRHTLLVAGQGDCFTKGTKVLRREGHALVPIESLRVGDEIWGLDRWSRVTATWERGVRATWLVELNNGSMIRLTPEHHVWVAVCQHYTRGTRTADKHCCHVEDRELVRMSLSEVRVGDVVLQPDRVGCGSQDMDLRRAYIEGLYAADGSCEVGRPRFTIAGRDGFPREAQKAEVAELCKSLGIETGTVKNEIRVNDPEWARRMASMGRYSWEKRFLSINLNEASVRETLRGVLVDSGRHLKSAGRAYSTASSELFLQVRVLLRMLGVSCSTKFLSADYMQSIGGTTTHGIYRLGIRQSPVLDSLGVIRDKVWREDAPKKCPADYRKKLLRVRSIERDDLELPCCDIETDDHYVWLPEADWTTSQCNNQSSCTSGLGVALGYPMIIRFVKADQRRPLEFSHVYSLIDVPDGKGGDDRIALDTTQAHAEPGWEPPYWEKMDFDVTSWQPGSQSDAAWLAELERLSRATA